MEPDSIADLLGRIRQEVRSERPYLVGSGVNIHTKLNQNESPFDLPADLKETILEAFASVSFNRYPEEHPYRLRDALAESLGCEPEGILVGNGSNELTHTLGLSLVAGGRRVVLPRPMFGLFETVVRLFDGKLTSVAPRQDLSFDADDLIAAVRQCDPALTIIATPNNPTGLEMSHDDVVRIVESAKGFVLVDEAYVEFGKEPSAVKLLESHPNVIIMRTLSKGFGLAALRIGYLVAHPRVIGELLKARLPFMVDPLAEIAAVTLLRNPDVISERVVAIKKSIHDLQESLDELGIGYIPSRTNFVLFKTPVEPAALIARLAASGVLIRNMSGYPELTGYVRVCAGTPDENKAFVAALKGALKVQTA